MKNWLLVFTILNISISTIANPEITEVYTVSVAINDTVCRDSSVCFSGVPFNLNLLCRPAGGVYYGSPAILGDQFNPITANIGSNMVYHGFVTGIDTIECCSFVISVIDTVFPAGIINGSGSVCIGETETYSIDPIANANSYSWSFSGSAIEDSITNTPSISLFFDNAFTSGSLNVQGINDLCANPGMVSTNFFININARPAATIRNVNDTITITDNLCKKARIHYYVVEPFKRYKWAVQNGKILTIDTSRNVTIDWDTVAGSSSLTVTVENESGCSGSSVRQVNIMNGTAPDPSVIWLFGYNMLVCSDSLINSYQWYNDNALIQYATNRYFLADTNNRNCYYVQTCIDACCNMSDPYCFFNPSAIDDLTRRTIRIFPNPAGEKIQIRIDLANGHNGRVSIFNQFGAMVKEMYVASGDFQIDLSLLPRGLYYIRYLNELDGVFISKIIKI